MKRLMLVIRTALPVSDHYLLELWKVPFTPSLGLGHPGRAIRPWSPVAHTHTHLLLDSHCDRCCSCWVPSWWSYIWFPSVMPAPPTQKEWTKRPNEVPVSSVFVNMLLSHGRPYLSWLPMFGIRFAYALSPGPPLFRNKILRQAIMAPIEQS